MTRITERLERNEELMEEIIKYSKAPKRSIFDRASGKKKTTKDFKFPTRITKGYKRKVKQNYALVVYIRNNGNIEFNYAPIVDDLIFNKHSGYYHSATPDYMLNYIARGRSYPVLIQPEWSLTPVKKGDIVNFQQVPFSARDHVDIIKVIGGSAAKQRILIDIVKQSQLEAKKGTIPGKMMIWIIVGIVVVLYLLNSVLG